MNSSPSFDFHEGIILAQKYEILEHIGSGWEGEVYLVRELGTDIERAAKFFFPKRNKNNQNVKFYAKKLHKLRTCSLLIQYHTQETTLIDNVPVTFLVSEFVDGELLSDFLKRQPGKRLSPFQCLHLLHALVRGVEEIHRLKEYHGDIHTGNIIVERHGLSFDLKLVDFFKWNTVSTAQNIHDDIKDMITVFYEAIGGKTHYMNHDDVIKSICLGLKSSLIKKKFRTASKLREYIENLEWH